ncbi:MAG: archease [Planctomycetes bacterium]|nr:archease [Planctomycetota bacterium]
MYETFEHTADLGLRIRAGSLGELFAEAGRGLFSVIVANLEAVRAVEEFEFEIEGERRDDLLVDWLAELLFTFDTRRVLLSEFDVKVVEDRIKATARGEPVDTGRHELDVEVKAITYHQLKVERDGDGWVAEVIVDL